MVVCACTDATEHVVCQSKYFRAKCKSADELVLIQRARYGRMNLSKCVRENFGYIGCSNDVIDIVDSHCSGRRGCSLRVLDENFMNMKPCHEDLKLYLSVQYSCVEGRSLRQCLYTGAGHFGHKTLRHHKIGAEVKPNHRWSS